MKLTNYAEEKIYRAVFRGEAFTPPAALYLALNSQDPTETGAVGELSGSGYARKQATFPLPTDGAGSNSNEIMIGPATSDWLTATHFTYWDAVSGGNPWLYGTLTTPKLVLATQSARALVGAMTVAAK